MNNGLSVLLTILIVLGVAFLGFFFFVGIAHIEGHELAIKETFSGGVDTMGGEMKDGVYRPKRHFYLRGLTDYVLYDMRVHHFVMNDKTEKDGEKGEGRPIDSLMVQFAGGSSKVAGTNEAVLGTSGGQKGKLSLDLQWRYNPARLLVTHAAVRNDPGMMQEKIIRNVMQRIVLDKCTVISALDAYYGESRVKLQKDIEDALRNNEELKDKGVIVDNFVMQIALDPKYEEQIAQKVVAYQSQQRFEAEKLANEKEALAMKAKSQIEANQKIVAAEAAKEVGILQKEQEAKQMVLMAQAGNESAILAAKAEQQKRVLEAEGKRDADVAEAVGILAKKTAEAKGEELNKLAKYDGVAGERQTMVLAVTAQAEKLKGMLQGVAVLPDNAFMSLTGDALKNPVQPVINVSK